MRFLLLTLVACTGTKPVITPKPVTAPVEATTRLHEGTPTNVGTIEVTFVRCLGERYTTSPEGPEKHAVSCVVELAHGSHRDSWAFLIDAPLDETIAQRPVALERVFGRVRFRVVGIQADHQPMHLDLAHVEVR